jgi:hypothetical protein
MFLWCVAHDEALFPALNPVTGCGWKRTSALDLYSFLNRMFYVVGGFGGCYCRRRFQKRNDSFNYVFSKAAIRGGEKERQIEGGDEPRAHTKRD